MAFKNSTDVCRVIGKIELFHYVTSQNIRNANAELIGKIFFLLPVAIPFKAARARSRGDSATSFCERIFARTRSPVQ